MPRKKNIVKKGAPSARRSTIHVGDIVQIRFGAGDLKGRVVEGRGQIGFEGRNLYRILVTMDGEEPMNIELPADEIRILRRAPAGKKIVRSRAAKVRRGHARPERKQESNEI